MKKTLILLTLIIFLFPYLFGFAPEKILEDNITNQTLTKKIIEHIENNQYTQAMKLIEEINSVNNFVLQIFKKNLLDTYKIEAIKNINSYIDNNQYENAKKTINILKKYFPNDYEINKIQQKLFDAITSSKLVEYKGNIEHIFTHCLLSDPAVALNKKNTMYNSYDTDCITKNEFKKILYYLYKNNYILIDINTIFSDIDGVITKNKLYLPVGKKPLIFSFDDVNYDHKKMNKGMVDKLIIDNEGRLATYTSNASNGNKISYDNEFVVILENFISLYPNFAFMGARGIICRTGYDSI